MQDATHGLGRTAQLGQGRPVGRPLATPGDAAEPAPAGHLLRLIAARMQGRPLSSIAAAPSSEAASPSSRETLIATAAALGIGAQFAERPLTALKEADFPCLILFNDGMALLATGLMNETTLLADTGAGIHPAPFAAITGRYSGLTLQLVPLAANDSAEATGRRSPALEIADHILSHQRPLLAQLALATGLSNVLLLVLPLFIMSVYDRIIPHFAMETLWTLAIGVAIAFGVDLGLRTARASLNEAIATAVGNGMQNRLYGRLLRLELAATPRLAGGIAVALQELDALCRIVPQAMVAVAVDLPFFFLVLGLLFYIGGAIVIAPLIGVALITLANFIAYSRSRRDNAASAAVYHQRANQLIETLSSIETVKAAGAEPQLLARWETLTDSAAYLGYRARHETNFAAQVAVIAVQATIVLALVIGVYEIKAGSATIGALAATSLLVGRAMAPMGSLVALLVRGFHILRSTDNLAAIERASIEQTGDASRPATAAFAGALAFGKVSFTYEEGAPHVLRDLSFSIEPGERVGLIGRIGCGKSTLLKLLPRYYQPSSGSLLVDGHDIRQYDPEFLRRHIALMPQEAVLLDLSLRDNIRFGLPVVDAAAFERAVTISGVKDFAGVHPQGYGMKVGPRGERLSGGERASVVLARTLLRDPRLLLLDEPTANMDNELERRVVARLDDWLGDRTLVLATHRAPMLALVDRVIWLNNGQVIADGPRDEILRRVKG